MIFDDVLAFYPRDTQEMIMSALDDLTTTADQVEQAVDNVAVPALDAIMAAHRSGGVPEAQVQAANDRIRSAMDRLADKAREAHALVDGEG